MRLASQTSINIGGHW